MEDDEARESHEDIEEFRRELQEDYGPEGLKEKAPEEGQDEQKDQEEPDVGAEEPAAEGGEKKAKGHEPVEEAPEEAAKEDQAEAGKPAREEEQEAEAPADVTEAKPGDEPGSVSREDPPAPDAKDPSAEDKPPGPEVEGKATTPESEVVVDQPNTEKPSGTDEGRPAQAEPESYNRNDDQVVVTKHAPGGPDRDSEGSVEIPDLQHFQVKPEQDEEPRTLEAVDYGRGANVRFPMSDLDAAGYNPPEHNAIVQLGVRPAEGEEVETVFARYSAPDRRAEAYVGDIGGGKGSRYELVEARGVDEDRVVSDFERGRCEHMQNVRLEHEEGRMFLNVDDRRVELEDYKMSTSGSHLVLRGKLEGEDSCKLEFDGRRASVKFGRDYPVEGMNVKDDVLSVKYEQSRNEKHEARLQLEHLDAPERPSLNQFDQPQMLEHLRVLNRPPGNEGMYQVSLDKPSRDEIGRLLAEAPDYGMMKAEISERLVPNLLESLGWERIERHPFAKTKKENVGSSGTDWLMRDPDGNMVLVEVKWYENRRDAVRKAASQVNDDFQIHKNDSNLDLRAAYIAIVEYDERSMNDKPMKIHVLRVVSKEDLR